jgi:hypothetical protein
MDTYWILDVEVQVGAEKNNNHPRGEGSGRQQTVAGKVDGWKHDSVVLAVVSAFGRDRSYPQRAAGLSRRKVPGSKRTVVGGRRAEEGPKI